MENLIVSFSQISDDTMRREKLTSLFDVELAAATAAAMKDDTVLLRVGDGGDTTSEIPRFAKLFQTALDTIGERVQASAREVASALATNDGDAIATSDDDAIKEGGSDNVESQRQTKEKSQEELQLWALIDMMVQSKTRVKLHMRKLGSKGEFR